MKPVKNTGQNGKYQSTDHRRRDTESFQGMNVHFQKDAQVQNTYGQSQGLVHIQR